MLTPLSPNVLGYDATPTPTAVELYKLLDAAGDEVTFTPFAMTVDGDGVFWGTLDGTCVPLASEGETWSLIWETTLTGYADPIYDRQTLLVGFESVVAIIVGTDSYVSVDDADAVLDKRLDTAAWDVASDDNKARALMVATRAIDSLRLVGQRALWDQTLEFPRAIYRGTSGDIGYGDPNYPTDSTVLPRTYMYSSAWSVDTSVPAIVVEACCLEAAARLEDVGSERAKLQAQGVTAITLGKLSETYGGKSSGLASGDALKLMRRYIVSSAVMR